MLYMLGIAILIVFVACVVGYVLRVPIARLLGRAQTRIDSSTEEVIDAFHKGQNE